MEVYEIEGTRRCVLIVKSVSVTIGMTTKDLEILHISNKQNSNSSSSYLQIAQNMVKYHNSEIIVFKLIEI